MDDLDRAVITALALLREQLEISRHRLGTFDVSPERYAAVHRLPSNDDISATPTEMSRLRTSSR